VRHRFWCGAAVMLAVLAACQIPSPSRPTVSVRPPPQAREDQRAALAQAEAAYAEGDRAQAERLADGVELTLLTPPERERALRLRAQLARDGGDTALALHWFAQLRDDSSGPAAERAQLEMDALVTALDLDATAAAAGVLGTRAPAAELWLRVGEQGLAEGRPELTARALEALRSLSLGPAERIRADSLDARVTGGGPGAEGLPPPLSDFEDAAPGIWAGGRLDGAIGVLLPLTGPLASVAEQTLQGVLLAAGVFDPGPLGQLRVLVRDTQGSPARAEAAIRDFAARGDVVAAIGPLLKEEVAAAADAAQATGLPLLTLTRRESVARNRDQVFRIGLTREAEAAALADHAGRLGIERVAILYPRDDYGREFREHMWRALEAQHIRVVGVAGYDPQATDFAAPIRSLIGYDLLTPEEVELIRERKKLIDRAKRLPPAKARKLREGALEMVAPDGGPLPPIVDFEALFIPDAHDKVGLIVPQLAFHEISGVRLFGPSGWHHPELLEIAGRHVEGAFFSSGFDAAHPSPLVSEFGSRFAASFGVPASVFAAQGFDAANLIQLQMLRGASSPELVRQQLLTMGVYPGVSGTMVPEPDGNLRRRPFLVGVQRGATISLE